MFQGKEKPRKTFFHGSVQRLCYLAVPKHSLLGVYMKKFMEQFAGLRVTPRGESALVLVGSFGFWGLMALAYEFGGVA